MNGYADPGYAESLAEFGRPRRLACSGGWILERPIAAGRPDRDAMGCYPLFACAHWPGLEADLEVLQDRLVSLVLVTDPFGDYQVEDLQRWFKDLVRPFKAHYITDLSRPVGEIASSHHRYYARRALRQVEVSACPNPAEFLETWIDLYANLIRRHELHGLHRFSPTAFARLLALPGVTVFQAWHGGEAVGAEIWILQGEAAYCHLAASSEAGYKLMAAYALRWFALEYFRKRVRWLDLGAGAGADGRASDGLGRFKRGWSTGTRPAYLCGRIFDASTYAALSLDRGQAGSGYFPAYRAGEFA
jgi:hypothetical protein